MDVGTKRMRQLLIIFGLTIITCDLLACECLPILTLEQQFKKADIVFYAKVQSLNDKNVKGFRETMHFTLDSLYTDKGGYHPTLRVKEVYKGKLEKDIELNIKSNWGLCDVFFKTGTYYIVFGYFDKDGLIQTSICTPTTMVTDKQLIRQIKKLK
ncbi:MAG: hypothetical protein KF687_06330 [Cyclobacteriaceae bacterium]|nr:hypothetical protein [Cyclobacteriaceae bacterium]